MKTFNRFSLLYLFLAITAPAASTPVALFLAPRAAHAQEARPVGRRAPHRDDHVAIDADPAIVVGVDRAQLLHGLRLPFRGGLPDFLKQAASPLTTAGG